MPDRTTALFATMLVLLTAPACGHQPTAPASTSGGTPSPVIVPLPTSIVVSTGNGISVGQHVGGTVTSSDPACYPRWDASGRCRQFTLTVQQDGNLRLTLSWTSSLHDAMDLFVVSPDDRVAEVYEGTTREQLTLAATAGSKYEIFAMAYVQPQDFVLDTEFQP